jgi:SWIM zinc finger
VTAVLRILLVRQAELGYFHGSMITEAFIDAAAPNADSIRNGRALVAKGKLSKLCRTADKTLIFGECAGSGSTPYRCSVDLADPAAPVARCSCPSRQFPCKHGLALMYALVQGQSFLEAEIPADLAEKRAKVQAKTEKKAAAAETPGKPEKPRTVNKSALKKKIEAQLKGLEILETLVSDIVRSGLGVLDAKAALAIDAQAKQLGDSFLPGAQGVLNELTSLFRSTDGSYRTTLSNTERDGLYREALERLTRAHAIAKRGRDYLQQRLADAELSPDTTSSIAAWLGHAWQLSELEALGCFEPDASLVQLSFACETNRARAQFIDRGIWVHLESGRLFHTQNIRPFKAVAHIRQEDSVFETVTTPKLFIYPGEGAPRARWEGAAMRPVTPADCARIRQAAPRGIAEIVKTARDQLKAPLASREAWTLIHFQRLGKAGGQHFIEDAAGARMELVDPAVETRPAALPLLGTLPPAAFADQTLLGCLRQDWDRGRLVMEPVALITGEQIIRFGY